MKSNDFITRHGRATFRHGDELFAAIRSGACRLDYGPDGPSPSPCSHFISIYRRRANHLGRFGSPHAASLLADTTALLAELERDPEAPCGIWGFSLPPHHIFAVFEDLNSPRILGCIRAVDDRLIDESTRAQLWTKRMTNERGSWEPLR